MVLQYCADESSDAHGDARRAIDLLRVAAEIAGRKGEKISKKHVDTALGKLQKDRVGMTLSSASYHLKLVAVALARITYLTDEVWHSTSTVYNQYRHITPNENKPLTYRRISKLLNELENMGLVISHTSSKGRRGYGTQYKLVVPPEVIGKVCVAAADSWTQIEQRKKEHDRDKGGTESLFAPSKRNSTSLFKRNNNSSLVGGIFDSIRDDSWKQFVGSE